jgi:hypothetical protein
MTMIETIELLSEMTLSQAGEGVDGHSRLKTETSRPSSFRPPASFSSSTRRGSRRF